MVVNYDQLMVNYRECLTILISQLVHHYPTPGLRRHVRLRAHRVHPGGSSKVFDQPGGAPTIAG